MTLPEYIQKAIDTAVAGTDPDVSIIQKLRMEAETLIDQVLYELAVQCAEDPEKRGRLSKNFSVTLTSGSATLPAGILVEYLREGSVRDADTQANGYGNVLVRVKYFNDLLKSLPTVFGYYCIENNKIYTRNINDGDLTATLGPLSIDAPFVPAKADIATDIPDEIQYDLVVLLATRLRGVIQEVA